MKTKIKTTQKDTRLKLTREFIERALNYYESDDFKNNYAYCLFEDYNGVQYQIKQVCEREFSLKLTNDQTEQIFDFMLENLDEYTSEFNTYWVGSFSIDSVAFGEQEEQLPENFLPVVSELKNDFVLNRGYLYHDLGGKGLHVSINKQIIETVLKITVNE